MKRCTKCKAEKPESEYYKRPGGLTARCKTCCHVYYEERRDAATAKQREDPVKNKKHRFDWNIHHPEKCRAAKAARQWIKRYGLQVPQTCSVPGCLHRGKPEKHHDRYDKPLQVAFLCSQHHKDANTGKITDYPIIDLEFLAYLQMKFVYPAEQTPKFGNAREE